MTLKEYRTKRKSGTPEPTGEKAKGTKDKLSFVVQRHDARRLHFDFRLEAHGVLKSWAVPKGPSMDPSDKRLAIEVEDHPLEYGKFEGTIPQGHYGAGTVEIWDKGTIEMEGCKTKKEAEDELEKEYKNGEIKFILHGKKLNGSFVLVRLKKEEKQPQWLLIKHREISQTGLKASPKAEQPKVKAKSNAADALPVVKEDFISNPDKIYWPAAEYTKQDLLNYYASVSKFILPHLKDRPIVMHRFPNGIEGEDFYQKDASEHTPKWVETVNVHHAHKDVHYLLAKDKRSLLYIANLGSIEIHAFLSRIDNLEYPDYAVLDLDPRGNPFSLVIDIARYLHEILNKAKIPAFCKTSGKKGLHVYIPTGGKYNFEFTHMFTQLISQILFEAFPKETTLKRDPDMNQKKVYLDSLQNAMTKTVVAPYSVRPTPDATVSTPLQWAEIKKGLDPQDFTITTIGKRLDKLGDLFKPLLNKKSVDMETWLKKLEKMFPGHS